MAGGEVDYGNLPWSGFRSPDAWDAAQGWQHAQDLATGPEESDISYGPGIQGFAHDEESLERQRRAEEEEAEEKTIRYYVPPKVYHPPARSHTERRSHCTLVKRDVEAEEAAEEAALRQLAGSPLWQVVRTGEAWQVLREGGAAAPGPPPPAASPAAGVRGVLVVVDPRHVDSGQRFVRELRSLGWGQTCICLVERSPARRDPAAVASLSAALLASGADEVLAENWLSYRLDGLAALGGRKAALSGAGELVPTGTAGRISFEAGYGAVNVYGPDGTVFAGS